MTLYYVKQDDSYYGCSEPGCCGESYEATEETFVKCECKQIEFDMPEHLQVCNGGGAVLKWRKAKKKEIQAYEDGKTQGFQEGSDWGIEWQKKKANDAAMKLFRANRDKTVHELVHEGYTVTIKRDEVIENYYEENNE